MGKGMCLLLTSAVSIRKQDHPIHHWNLAEFIYQCWGLSNEQIKFNSQLGRGPVQGIFLLVLVANSQPGVALVLDPHQLEYVRLLKPRPAAQALHPAWPPAGTTHALHTLPCFQLCESCISQGCRPPPFLRRDGALAWPYPSRESPWGRALLQRHLGWISTLSEMWQGTGATIIFICSQAGGWIAWPAPFGFWSQGNLKNLKRISGCLNYFLSIQTGKSIERKPESNTCKLKGHHVTCDATLVPGRLIWNGDYPMPEFCLVSQGSQKSHSCPSPAGYLSALELTISLLCY